MASNTLSLFTAISKQTRYRQWVKLLLHRPTMNVDNQRGIVASVLASVHSLVDLSSMPQSSLHHQQHAVSTSLAYFFPSVMVREDQAGTPSGKQRFRN